MKLKLILRPELVEQLDQGLRYPLVLMIAPAGSGKSVLLEQWRAQFIAASNDHAVISIQIKAIHNEGDILFRELFEALKDLAGLWEAPFFNLFKNDQLVDPDNFIAVFCQALKNVESNLCLIFDDFHLVNDSRIHSTIATMISRLPGNVTLLISSRHYPLFSVARLKMEGLVLTLDGNDLKLNKDDLNQLNKSLGINNMPNEQMFRLIELTDGWLVGAKLALLAYEKSGPAALDTFTGSQPELLDYFAYEVLNKLRPSLRKFVLITAFCDSFNQMLCESIMQLDYTAAKLEAVRMQALFLSEDPNMPGWYRYHPLLREFLVKRLEIEEGQDYIYQLHAKAAVFFFDQGLLSRSIHHARESDRHTLYIQTLTQSCEMWLRRGDLLPMIEQLDEITDEELFEHSDLLIYKLFALSFSRRFNQAAYYLEALNKVRPASRLNKLVHYQYFFEHFLLLFQNEAEIQKHVTQDRSELKDFPTDITAFLKILDAYTLMCNGQLNQAFRMANEARAVLREISHDFFESFATPIIILCDRYLGRGVEAVTHMQQTFAPIREAKRTHCWINIATGTMVVEYEQNQLDKARQLNQELTPIIHRACATDAVAMVYMYGSRILHLQGYSAKAQRFLAQLERILLLGDYRRFASQVVHEKMRQAYSDGLHAECEAICKQYHLVSFGKQADTFASDHYEEWRERNTLALAYYLLSKSKFSQADELLGRLAEHLDALGIRTRALTARCNQSVIALRQGKHFKAMQSLKRNIKRYGLVCFSRSVFDEAPGLETLFAHALGEQTIELPALFLGLFGDLVKPENADEKQVQAHAILTQKELDIFELLAAGLNNTEISEQSGIALTTTKWHLKNIYNKLGVENRGAAMCLAHSMEATKGC